MPFYDYSCTVCNHVQEEMHSIKEDPAITCKSCGHSPMTRNICTQPQVVFKGEGWPSKKGRVAKQMADAQNRAEKKQVVEWGHLKQSQCVPNFEGNITGDPGDPNAWRDAGKMAKEAGKDASEFEAKAVECEQNRIVPDHLKSTRIIGTGSTSTSTSKPASGPAKSESMPLASGMTQTSSD